MVLRNLYPSKRKKRQEARAREGETDAGKDRKGRVGQPGSLAANHFSGQREAIFPSEVGGGSPGKSYLPREIDGPQRNSDSINFSLKGFQISPVCPQIICSGKTAPRHGKQEGWRRAVEFSEHEEQSKSSSLRTENTLRGEEGCLAPGLVHKEAWSRGLRQMHSPGQPSHRFPEASCVS